MPLDETGHTEATDWADIDVEAHSCTDSDAASPGKATSNMLHRRRREFAIVKKKRAYTWRSSIDEVRRKGRPIWS